MEKISSKKSAYPPRWGSGVRENFGLSLTAKSFLRLNLARSDFHSSQILPNSFIFSCVSYCQKAMARCFRSSFLFALLFYAEKDSPTKLFSSQQKICQSVYWWFATQLLTRCRLGEAPSSVLITDKFCDSLSC